MAFLSPALARVRSWSECALNIAFPWPVSQEEEPKPIEPPFCRQCGYPYPALESDAGEFVCSNCQIRHWHFEWARAAYQTDGQVHEAITGFKYHDEYYRRSQLVEWLTVAFDRHAASESWDGLVPVPLHHRHRRARGFNQAHELACGLGHARQLSVRDCLCRDRETPSQTGLERNARWENMNGAFRMKGRFDVTGQNLLLIDDVFTTGATTNACAHALVQAGAGRLAVLTVSRS